MLLSWLPLVHAEPLVKLRSTVFAAAYRLGGIRAPRGPLPEGGRLAGPSVMQTVG